jgi:hypothetical protein
LSGGYFAEEWEEEDDHFHLWYFSACTGMTRCYLGDSLVCPIHLSFLVTDSWCYMTVRSAGFLTQAVTSFIDERQSYRQKYK